MREFRGKSVPGKIHLKKVEMISPIAAKDGPDTSQPTRRHAI
jgi:hypothetical protein